MKIVVLEKPQVIRLTKEETKVGELYILDFSENTPAHFRCQGGFVSMSGGAFTSYEGTRSDTCWVHLPNAELHLNN